MGRQELLFGGGCDAVRLPGERCRHIGNSKLYASASGKEEIALVVAPIE
jgi:hypothetical protein